MKYAILLGFMALAFGLCFLGDKVVTAMVNRAKNRKRVMPPLRYPVMAVVLALAGGAVAWYGLSIHKPLYMVVAAVFLAVAVWSAVYYCTTGITYDGESFTFRRGSFRKTFRFDQIRGQRSDVTMKIKCLVLCVEDQDVVLYSNMQGYVPFLTCAYESWCRAKGLDPTNQDWHDPADTRWFPEEAEEESEDEETAQSKEA